MEALDNLVRIRRLKAEPPDAKEFAGMIRAAETKLRDASIEGLSPDSQFSLAYGAAHALSLAALRCAGTGIGQKAATLSSSAFSIPLACPTQNGVCSINVMLPATSPNTKATWM